MNRGDKLTYIGGEPAIDKYIAERETVTLVELSGTNRVVVKNIRGQELLAESKFFSKTVYAHESKNTELLAFVAHRVQLCQQDNFYGSLTVIFENGKVVRTKTERSEVPS